MSDEHSVKGILATKSSKITATGAARSPEDGKISGKSYRAPASMFSALLIGLGLALAQHFLYAHLNNRPVPSVSISQAWISRISTGLAFAVKVALTICVGVAFIQYQWWRLRQRPFRVAEIDSLTSALGNVLCLSESTVWFRNPMLTIMAIISWTIPLSAVITPGTLSVQPVQDISTVSLQVPQPLYNLTNFGSIAMAGGGWQMTEDPRMIRLLTSTASSGTSVALQSRYQNQTYSLRFDGPALKCGSANESTVFNSTFTYGTALGGAGGSNTEYVSWVPNAHYGESTSLDYDSTDAARIFTMTNTGFSRTLMNATIEGYSQQRYKVNVTECLLYNASYNVDFTFRYPNQTRDIRLDKYLNPVPLLVSAGADSLTPTTQPSAESYLVMMSAFGKLLVGQATTSHYGYTTNNSTGFDVIDIDWSRAEAVQHGLEQLFQNYTLSLLSDDGLIKNSSLASFISVQVETWPITYVYTRTDLFLAYGLSLLAALICSGFGLYAFIANNASYQNMFSTYLRAINTAGLDRYIDESDKGQDPLPKRLEGIKVDISDQKPDAERIELSQRRGDQ